MAVNTPLPVPTVSTDAGPPELDDAQQGMYDKMYEQLSPENYAIPGEEKGALTEDEKFWLSHECILRYLRASKWNVETAKKRLEATLKWRREYDVYDGVTASHVEPEAVTGKQILLGYDTHRRPAYYMIPSRQNTSESPRQVQHTVWMLERAVDLMGPGVETLALLINFADRGKNPSFSTARSVLNIIQEHYPERLGSALIINIPFLVNAFFKLILPLVDPVTRLKLHFNPAPLEDNLFTQEQLMKEWWGGSVDFEYVHEAYWPTLVQMCEEKVRKEREAWQGMGAKVGLKEWEFKRKALGSAVQGNGVATEGAACEPENVES